MSLDAKILEALRAAGDGSVSGAELSETLGVSRAAVWARIADLRALGYDIPASPHLGYRLICSPDLLHADDLISRLGKTQIIGRDIQVFEQTTSTNDVIQKLAIDLVDEGAVVFAEAQTQGRGRMGRNWLSPVRKGLWFSILLRPKLQPQEATQLTVASATALRRAIYSHCGLKAGIKWPNDLLIEERKVAGILTEMHAELDRIKFLILGIGINVNLKAADFPADLRAGATSLEAELGRPLARAELAVAILRELDWEYSRLNSGQFSEIAEEWEKHCTTLGQNVVIHIGNREVRGRAESLGEDGALLVRTEYGRLERIIGGDISLEK